MQSTGEHDDGNRLLGQGTNRSFYLPRLPREYYQGDAVVHWTMAVAMRGTGWLNDLFHARFREVMLHAAARESLFCPTYCLMPDHIHLVWMGLRRETDQRNGMKFLREHVGKLLRPHRFQHQPHDHVLREEQRRKQAFSKVFFYVPGQRPCRRTGEASEGLAVRGGDCARLSRVASVGRRFLAATLETLPCRSRAGCRQHQTSAASLM